MHRSVKGFATVLALALFTMWAPATARAQEEVRAAIQTIDQQMSAAVARGDAAQIAGMYTSTAEMFPPNGDVVQGREAIQKLWQSLLSANIADIAFTTVEVQGMGDTAYEVATFVVKAKDGKVVDRGKSLVIWKKEQGQWKLHRDMWNTSVPTAGQ